MDPQSERACLAYAMFDLWMTRQLEQLVVQWTAWAAPCDRMGSIDLWANDSSRGSSRMTFESE